jgi:polysaccharide deacetylase 2 family uncharacterized protein YibQ
MASRRRRSRRSWSRQLESWLIQHGTGTLRAVRRRWPRYLHRWLIEHEPSTLWAVRQSWLHRLHCWLIEHGNSALRAMRQSWLNRLHPWLIEHEPSALRAVRRSWLHRLHRWWIEHGSSALRALRRRWSHRLRYWLLEHKDSGVRAALGAALLAAVWLLWPGPGHDGSSERSAGRAERQAVADGEPSDGLVAAAQASVAVSAKRQLVGEAAVVRARLEQRLRQVARTMPDIGMPDQAEADPTRSAAKPATGLLQSAVTAAPDKTGALAGKGPSGESATAMMVTRAGPAEAFEGEAATHVAALPDRVSDAASSGRRAGAARTMAPEVPPNMIMPAAAPSAPEPSAAQDATSAIALLPAPAGVLADRPGRTPTWLRNAVATVPDSRPAIAVVIDDLGLNRRGTAALNHLRAPLTLAFLPYATDLDEQTQAARAAGHELLVHMPMEPRGEDWPGPNALTMQLGPAELVSRLRGQLRSFRGFVGINNHMGSLLTSDAARMDLVMAELRQRDLLFLDSRTTRDSVAAREAQRMQVPFAERDVFIDNQLDLQSVLRELTHAEHIARHQGYAVAMGHPHDVTIEALRRWLPSLDARGIALVPISAIVARRSCASGIILVGDACARYAVAETTAQ